MSRLCSWFVKLTGWLPYTLVFRAKYYYEDRKVQGRKIHGPAIIISNHTSVWDYAQILYTFPENYLQYQMAELLYEKGKFMAWFLKHMGGIRVDRNSHDFSFCAQSLTALSKKGIVGVFPEARIPEGEDERHLPFKPSITYLGLESGVKIIPLYTDGEYFSKKRAHVVIGKPIYLQDLYDQTLDEKTNIENITIKLREKIMELSHEIKRKDKKKRKNI